MTRRYYVGQLSPYYATDPLERFDRLGDAKKEFSRMTKSAADRCRARHGTCSVVVKDEDRRDVVIGGRRGYHIYATFMIRRKPAR